MRLNPDCVRIVILTIENKLKPNDTMDLNQLMENPLVQSFTRDDIEYSLIQLAAEKMIECEITDYISGETDYLITDVTPEGHRLCGKLSDNSLFAKLKPYLSELTTIADILLKIAELAV